MNDKLRPLTESEAEEFDRRRESKSVIHTKCDRCGAWYETYRLQQDFIEKFDCDCGQPMQFFVPALELEKKLITPSNEAILALNITDNRLDTGMRIEEAIARAQQWWHAKGRKEAKTQLKRQAKPVGGADGGAGSPFASTEISDVNFMPSGIIHGKAWDRLNKREKVMVVKVWHHFYVRKPDLLGEDDKAEHTMQERGKIK